MKYAYVAALAAILTVSLAYPANAQSIIELTSEVNPTIKADSRQTVTWTTENFPAEAKVDITLIQKVSDSPARYEAVRELAAGADNTGSFEWIPRRSEAGSNFAVEVGCSSSSEFPQGCRISSDEYQTFAIKAGFGSNLAGAFSAIFDLFARLFGN